MKTKELIKQLQELDPEGECQVFTEGDIYYCERLPWYYDGKPGILVRDEKLKPYYDVIGMRQITPDDGDKIYIKSLTLDDVISEQYDDTVDDDYAVFSGDERFMQRVADCQKYWKAWGESFTKDRFKTYIDEIDLGDSISTDTFNMFWETYKDKLNRNDFVPNKTSINDKRKRWFNDCVLVRDGTIEYITGYEEKNYNEVG